ncbi:hypothetical protein LEP1GSC148_4534 [Leptospira interrogans serovar Canicola str. LT1962]|uniref:Uncharacterized protein n=1 Tax=Leptospira interrogans str. 2006001854 TaxID=1001590 RepID=M6G5W6_LEPIR|nr:hypothetical protein LEP1GSC148_4534 [Leptospira interrogans serovar Canicola str. LT1962]EMM80373.1 hypothetical protein LEP1GSC037_1198 [Leptospira interrogans str. 2006001854]
MALAFGIFLGLNPFSQIDSEVIPLEFPFPTEEERKKTDWGPKQLQAPINPQIYRKYKLKHKMLQIRLPLPGKS